MKQTGLIERLKRIGRRFKEEVIFYKLMLKDSRTPKLAKLLLWMALGYALLPFDLIPDFIPIIGQIDDLVIIPLLVIIALKIIPKEVKTENKMKVKQMNKISEHVK